ncbi:hypothetical protein ACFWEH_36575 [Streptomyces anulatus]|uniref:hypothetical protein n=1 Tax=Streptomyces anulatus TaxID=1892 RepID=UPI00364D2997
MNTRRPLGTGPVPAVDTPGTPGAPVPRAVLAAERLNGVAAGFVVVPLAVVPAGRQFDMRV